MRSRLNDPSLKQSHDSWVPVNAESFAVPTVPSENKLWWSSSSGNGCVALRGRQSRDRSVKTVTYGEPSGRLCFHTAPKLRHTARPWALNISLKQHSVVYLYLRMESRWRYNYYVTDSGCRGGTELTRRGCLPIRHTGSSVFLLSVPPFLFSGRDHGPQTLNNIQCLCHGPMTLNNIQCLSHGPMT